MELQTKAQEKANHISLQVDDLSPSFTTLRVDSLYCNSLNQATTRYHMFITYHSIKLLTLLIFTVAYYSQSDSNKLFSGFILAILLSLASLTIYVMFIRQLKKIEINKVIAEFLYHARREPVAEMMVEPVTFEDMRSETYDFTNPNNSKLADDQKKKLQNNMTGFIVHAHMERQRMLKLILVMTNLTGVALIFYFIIELATQDIERGPLIVASIFISFEIIAKIDIILMMFFCLIMPVILLVTCLVMCCCGKRFGQTELPQIPVIKYTPNMELQCDPECRICFQNFNPEEELMILPCNNKHAFHRSCIQHWFKVSTKCPLCRKQLSVPLSPRIAGGNNMANQ